MYCKKLHWIHNFPFRINLQKMAHSALSMHNCIHYFLWAAVLIVVSNSFLTGNKSDTYGIYRKPFCLSGISRVAPCNMFQLNENRHLYSIKKRLPLFRKLQGYFNGSGDGKQAHKSNQHAIILNVIGILNKRNVRGNIA